MWAKFIGAGGFRGATTLTLLVALVLVMWATYVGLRRRAKAEDRYLLTLLGLTALVPPALLFVLSVKPISLPVFGLRHLLPGIVPFCLLCAYGLRQLSREVRFERVTFAGGAFLLLVLALLPTAESIRHLPRRIPYGEIAETMKRDPLREWPAYTAWQYGIGEPANFYSLTPRVRRLTCPTGECLRERLLFLYRPALKSEREQYSELVRRNYRPLGFEYYTTDLGDTHGTRVVRLQRQP